ncbi:DMT family transporter [Candidiatus Paracoxiella cheracis]|uniref:DMT family transporter n=1 Tax=Candidiatus Paracoxiella cheracis TaxID=3405120 RepID=UPI003BF5F4E1
MIEHESPYSRQTLMILLVLMVFFWGLNWPFMKLAIPHISAWFYVFLRMLLGMITVGIYLVATKQFEWPSRRVLPLIIGVGLLQMTVCNVLMVGSLKYIEASRGVILSYSTPLWVAPAAILFFKEKFNGAKILGIVLGFVGILLLFNPLTFSWHNHPALIASALLLLASATWAASIVLMREYRTGFPTICLTFWQFLVPVIIFAIPVFRHNHAVITATQWSWELVGLVLYGGVIATGFCFVIVIMISKYVPSTTTSLTLLGVPVAGMVLSALILHEMIGINKVAAMLGVIVGIILVLYADKKLMGDSVVSKVAREHRLERSE